VREKEKPKRTPSCTYPEERGTGKKGLSCGRLVRREIWGGGKGNGCRPINKNVGYSSCVNEGAREERIKTPKIERRKVREKLGGKVGPKSEREGDCHLRLEAISNPSGALCLAGLEKKEGKGP